MQLIFVTTFAALSSLAFGFPSDNQYGGCSGSRDKCYNAVFQGPGHNIKNDCKSFLETVIVSCPVTSTSTKTQTHTAKGTTITLVGTSVLTNFETTTDLATSSQTDSASTTLSLTTTGTVTATATTFVATSTLATVTVSTTSTVTITSFITAATTTAAPSVPPLARRDPHVNNPPQCHPTTSKGGDIPWYADCCGSSAYSSACSCLGVTPSTTTLMAKTVVTTTTVDKTVTPTITHYTTTVSKVTNLQTYTSVTVTQVTTTATILATTTAFVTITGTVTNTNTLTDSTTTYVSSTTFTTTTAGVTATACPIMESTGPNAGQYLAEDSNNSGLLYWVSDVSDAIYFTLDSQSRLVNQDGLFVLTLPGVSSYVPLQGGGYEPGDDGTVTLTCSFDVNLVLTCGPTGGGANSIWVSLGSQYLVFGAPSDISNYGYVQVTLVQVC